MDGPAILSLRWDNILAVTLIVLGWVLIAVLIGQAIAWSSSNGSGGYEPQ